MFCFGLLHKIMLCQNSQPGHFFFFSSYRVICIAVTGETRLGKRLAVKLKLKSFPSHKGWQGRCLKTWLHWRKRMRADEGRAPPPHPGYDASVSARRLPQQSRMVLINPFTANIFVILALAACTTFWWCLAFPPAQTRVGQ